MKFDVQFFPTGCASRSHSSLLAISSTPRSLGGNPWRSSSGILSRIAVSSRSVNFLVLGMISRRAWTPVLRRDNVLIRTLQIEAARLRLKDGVRSRVPSAKFI